MLNECIGCFETLETNVYGVCDNCWRKRLTPGERVLAQLLQQVTICQEHQQSLGVEIAQLKKAVENLSRIIKCPADELDEAVGMAKRLMKAFESKLKQDDSTGDDGETW